MAESSKVKLTKIIRKDGITYRPAGGGKGKTFDNSNKEMTLAHGNKSTTKKVVKRADGSKVIVENGKIIKKIQAIKQPAQSVAGKGASPQPLDQLKVAPELGSDLSDDDGPMEYTQISSDEITSPLKHQQESSRNVKMIPSQKCKILPIRDKNPHSRPNKHSTSSRLSDVQSNSRHKSTRSRSPRQRSYHRRHHHHHRSPTHSNRRKRSRRYRSESSASSRRRSRCRSSSSTSSRKLSRSPSSDSTGSDGMKTFPEKLLSLIQSQAEEMLSTHHTGPIDDEKKRRIRKAMGGVLIKRGLIETKKRPKGLLSSILSDSSDEEDSKIRQLRSKYADNDDVICKTTKTTPIAINTGPIFPIQSVNARPLSQGVPRPIANAVPVVPVEVPQPKVIPRPVSDVSDMDLSVDDNKPSPMKEDKHTTLKTLTDAPSGSQEDLVFNQLVNKFEKIDNTSDVNVLIIEIESRINSFIEMNLSTEVLEQKIKKYQSLVAKIVVKAEMVKEKEESKLSSTANEPPTRSSLTQDPHEGLDPHLKSEEDRISMQYVSSRPGYHVCLLCMQEFSSQHQFMTHINSKQHMAAVRLKVQEANGQAKPSKMTVVSIKCRLCDVTLCSQKKYSEHVAHRSHRTLSQAYIKIGKPIPEPEVNYKSTVEEARVLGREFMTVRKGDGRDTYFCSICKEHCSSELQVEKHVRSQEHHMVYNLMTQPPQPSQGTSGKRGRNKNKTSNATTERHPREDESKVHPQKEQEKTKSNKTENEYKWQDEKRLTKLTPNQVQRNLQLLQATKHVPKNPVKASLIGRTTDPGNKRPSEKSRFSALRVDSFASVGAEDRGEATASYTSTHSTLNSQNKFQNPPRQEEKSPEDMNWASTYDEPSSDLQDRDLPSATKYTTKGKTSNQAKEYSSMFSDSYFDHFKFNPPETEPSTSVRKFNPAASRYPSPRPIYTDANQTPRYHAITSSHFQPPANIPSHKTTSYTPSVSSAHQENYSVHIPGSALPRSSFPAKPRNTTPGSLPPPPFRTPTPSSSIQSMKAPATLNNAVWSAPSHSVKAPSGLMPTRSNTQTRSSYSAFDNHPSPLPSYSTPSAPYSSSERTNSSYSYTGSSVSGGRLTGPYAVPRSTATPYSSNYSAKPVAAHGFEGGATTPNPISHTLERSSGASNPISHTLQGNVATLSPFIAQSGPYPMPPPRSLSGTCYTTSTGGNSIAGPNVRPSANESHPNYHNMNQLPFAQSGYSNLKETSYSGAHVTNRTGAPDEQFKPHLPYSEQSRPNVPGQGAMRPGILRNPRPNLYKNISRVQVNPTLPQSQGNSWSNY